jgi:hypothetical protein
MPEGAVDRLDALAALTRRYAAWGRGGTEGGLPLAWGGLTLILLVLAQMLLALAAEELQRLAPHPFEGPELEVLHAWNGWGAYLGGLRPLFVALLALAWVLGKDAFRDRLYQPLGRVEPPVRGDEVWVRRLSRGTLVAAGIGAPVLAFWHAGALLTRSVSPLALNLGLTACWALPWLGWFRVRGIAESITWTLMALMTLMWLWIPASNGRIGALIYFAGAAGGLISFAVGVVQHLRFRKLAAEMRALEAS